MKNSLETYINDTVSVIKALNTESIRAAIEAAKEIIVSTVKSGLPILVCGNGGSAADAMHIAGELIGRFGAERAPINAIALSADVAALTAIANDYAYSAVFARQVQAHGVPGAVLIAISTSGTSANIIQAADAARGLGMKVIALTGSDANPLTERADVTIGVPSRTTPLIQQGHQVVYHYLCFAAEQVLVR